MTRLLLVVIGLLVVALAVQDFRVGRARAAAVQSALVRDSIEAVHDTTREVDVAALEDSVRVFVRRAQQQAQRPDGLDRALKVRRMARVDTDVRIAGLDTVVRSETVYVSPDSGRRARFFVRQAPYTIAGEISRHDQVDSAHSESVSVHVDLDSIPLQLRLSCETGRGTPVHGALVAAVAPAWARLAIGRIEQAPEVCNPTLSHGGRGASIASLLRRAGMSVGAAALAGRDGQIVVRPAIMVGVRIWP